MGIAEWGLAALVCITVVFVILRPDLWGKRDAGRLDGEGGFYAADGRRRDHDDNDGDGDGGD